MRFNVVALISAAILAGQGIAATIGRIQSRSLVTELGEALGRLEIMSGARKTEHEIDDALGGSLSKLEDILGTTFAEHTLGIINRDKPPGAIQALGTAIRKLGDGLGVPAVNAWLDEETFGFYTDIEDVLGITDIEKALGLIGATVTPTVST